MERAIYFERFRYGPNSSSTSWHAKISLTLEWTDVECCSCKTSTLPPSMSWKLTEHGRCWCMQNTQLLTKNHVVILLQFGLHQYSVRFLVVIYWTDNTQSWINKMKHVTPCRILHQCELCMKLLLIDAVHSKLGMKGLLFHYKRGIIWWQNRFFCKSSTTNSKSRG